MNYTPGQFVTNAQGFRVRAQARKAIRPAVDRFFDHIAEIDCGMPDKCWLWQKGPLFRVNNFIEMRPWKFIYELMDGTPPAD